MRFTFTSIEPAATHAVEIFITYTCVCMTAHRRRRKRGEVARAGWGGTGRVGWHGPGGVARAGWGGTGRVGWHGPGGVHGLGGGG